MARYFFDLTDSTGFHRDQFGVECEGLLEARDQAVSLLPDVAREELPDGDRHEIRVQVRDAANEIVYDALALCEVAQGRPESNSLNSLVGEVVT